MTDRREKLGQLLGRGAKLLGSGGIDTARLDARLLLQHACQFSRNEMITRDHDPVSTEHKETYENLISRRLAGEPANRIIGEQSFYGRDFEIDASTLVPRQDTESILDCALGLLEKTSRSQRVLDLCTGSGILAVALACEKPDLAICACDISREAMRIARRNAEKHGVGERITWFEGDLLDAVEGSFDLVISNPPYVRSLDLARLDREVRDFDPVLALDGGADGLEFYRRIFASVAQYLRKGGVVVVEFGHDQAEDVDHIATENGFVVVERITDMGGKDRGLAARLDADMGVAYLHHS